MRCIEFLCCLLLAACAPGALNSGAPYAYDGGNEISNDAVLNLAEAPFPFDASKFPPQCDPTSSFPDGKVPDDFLTNASRPGYDKFNACVMADAKAHAKGIEILYYMEDSKLKTECAAADYFPDHRIQPSFYARQPPDYEHRSPEFERYVACLIAEARRDGGTRRLASPASFPAIGTCYVTRITSVDPTYVQYENGLSLVDYDQVRALKRSRVGDRIKVCVVDLPQDCPGFDLRGIGYRSYNYRTGEHWEMGDYLHECRGA